MLYYVAPSMFRLGMLALPPLVLGLGTSLFDALGSSISFTGELGDGDEL